MNELSKDTKRIKDVLQKFNNDWCPALAGAIAYSSITSLIPLAISFVALLGFAFTLLDIGGKQILLTNISSFFPKGIGTQDVTQTLIVQLSKIYSTLGIISLVLSLYGGSRLFVLLENCFDLIYRVPQRTFIKQNLRSVLMVLLFTLFIPIMILTTLLPNSLNSLLTIFGLSSLKNQFWLISSISTGSSLLFSYLFFQLIYLFVPNKKVSFSKTWHGSVIAAVLFYLYLTLFPLYVSHFLTGSVGQFAFALIFLAFFYYFAFILLIGAEINSYWGYSIKPFEKDFVTTFAFLNGKNNAIVKSPKLNTISVYEKKNSDGQSTFLSGFFIGIFIAKLFRSQRKK